MSRKYDNIPGYPGYYVTRSGKVYSRKSGEWRLRKLSFIKGDPSICLRNKYGIKSFRVYKLVAKIYVHNPDPKHYNVVRHLDDNKLNLRASNLAWGTQKDNMDDAKRNGKLAGSTHKASMAKLTLEQLKQVFELRKQGLLHKDIGKIMGVSSGTICRAINRKTYKDENIY